MSWVGPGIKVALVARYDFGQAVDALPGGRKETELTDRECCTNRNFLDAI